MGLDLIPRVDGEVVDADSTSVVELYKVVSLYIYRSLKLRSIILYYCTTRHLCQLFCLPMVLYPNQGAS